MFNCNLVASDNVSINATHNVNQFADKNTLLYKLTSIVKNLDRRAQKVFNQLASVRSQKPTKQEFGWGKYDGFA